MAKIVSTVAQQLDQKHLGSPLTEAAVLLRQLVPADAYVGEVYSLGYEEALVQIHDFHRRQVGGIPSTTHNGFSSGSPQAPDRRRQDYPRE